jgi:hypothetical protein
MYKPTGKPNGRPSLFTKELAMEICVQLSDGASLRAVCAGLDMPDRRTVKKWVLDDKEGFAIQYARARQMGYEDMADDVLDIADNGTNDYMDTENGPALDKDHIQRSKLRVDTRKWMLSKVLPKVYGDKLEVEQTSFNVTISGDSAKL